MRSLLSVLLAALLLGGGCGRAQEASFETADDLTIKFATTPSPPVAGAGAVIIAIEDAAGRPLDGAKVAVEGNMTHAGMVPITGETEASERGVYTVSLDWSMGGDWYVDVTVTLPDGQIARRRFAATVDILCTTE